ncbi:MAG: right-handed parallel beta-helix repeat-containing protein [Anaerolineales bacterium]|nr:right-handed parallel beta-helix repeat-containing protein [Anaerolineales bacterium]
MKLRLKFQKSFLPLFILLTLGLIAATTIEADNSPSNSQKTDTKNRFLFAQQARQSRLSEAPASTAYTYTTFLPHVILDGLPPLLENQAVNQPEVNAITISPLQDSAFSGFIFLPIIFKAKPCHHVIERNVGIADARTNYANVKPGETVCIRAGTRNRLMLKNFKGTHDQPITFINFGGQVIFNQASDFGIYVRNSRFIHITGTGDSNITYGFKIEGNFSAGMMITDKSSNYEVDHIEIANIKNGDYGSGILAHTRATCPDGSANNYDYDGDGSINNDLNDVVSRTNFTQLNSIFHHNYIHNTYSSGFYLGSSWYVQGDPVSCANGVISAPAVLLKGVEIYNNIVEDTGMDGVQVGSAVENCDIHHNEVYRDSRIAHQGDETGIIINKGSVCNVYNNLIKDGGGVGIYVQGNGGNKIYNNVIINAGQNNSPNIGYGIKITTGSNTGNSIYVLNNTIIRPKEIGISYQNQVGSNNLIQNNIIVQPGGGDKAYIALNQQIKIIKVSHNLTIYDMAVAKFVNPDSDNYSLRSDSPAIDAGLNLSAYGITTDYKGNARPQGANFDLGAYEFVLATPPPPTPTPTDTPTPLPPTPTPTDTPTPIFPTETPTPVPTDTPTPVIPTDTPVP